MTSIDGAFADPVEAARSAGLRYVRDDRPGYRRRRHGRGFCYFDCDGEPIRDARRLRRLRGLAIPPAWEQVWICPDPSGHVQATGRDARGRKQYRYHDGWREVRDATKFERSAAFGAVLPVLRRRIDEDLGLRGLPREKVLAAVLRLIDETLIRVGNQEYARDNESYGATTMRDEHVEVEGSRLAVEFVGKGGKLHRAELSDRRLARVVQRLQDLPGEEVFQYLDEAGERRGVDSADVNDYLREISGQEFTVKDFRTWGASALCMEELCSVERPTSKAARTRAVNAAIADVALALGNTPAVCKRAYVHPALVDAYIAGTLPVAPIPAGRRPDGLGAWEAVLLAFVVALEG